MTRLALTTTIVLALAGPAAASDQLRLSVAADLRRLGFQDVNVERLTPAQLAGIHAVANEKRRGGGRRGAINSILAGPNTLRSLFR